MIKIHSGRGGLFSTSPRRWIAMGLMAAMLTPSAIGCYGRFPLTRAIYNFNGDVSNDKIIRSVVMWAFIIIPVYGIAALGDVLIFNLVQFWTGETLHVGSVTDKNGITTALAPSADGREAILTISREGRILEQQRFVRVSPDRIEVRNRKGDLSGLVLRTQDGRYNLTDAKGKIISTIAPKSLGL